jgi:hypothetical protein
MCLSRPDMSASELGLEFEQTVESGARQEMCEMRGFLYNFWYITFSLMLKIILVPTPRLKLMDPGAFFFTGVLFACLFFSI